ncbi:MAG: HD domain-containing protein [Candidatus Pacebacteria bacterium]|jgi:GTP pyrophosphokinase|nr:HD domain-containing protein [Candidatus Paceibacterota bacterium]MDP6659802.1 HD domain-containing protein [Candidatus Paceibacterota bacterium]|tara:strand:- start:3639 stop:5189 length:1551 start_codon:yes stop_codon:yes gene_type:complete
MAAELKEILNLMSSPTKEDVALVTKAYDFAKEAHKGHKRYSGEPFFNHLSETAKGLATIGMGPRTIAAGLLHDSIEDTDVTGEEIEKDFGKEVLFLVEGVTKLGTLKYRGVQRHTESLRKLFVATSQDVRVVIVKLVDRLHNMKTLEYVPKNKRKRIALETLEVYTPIADRLGMGRLKRELEDLAFPYVHHKKFEKVKELLSSRSRVGLENLQKIHKRVKKELVKEGVTDFKTEHRIKGIYSLFKKLERKNWDIDEIHDIIALRIIVPDVADCYRVLGAIHKMWTPLPGKIKDYIAFPKPNGYQSIHTTIFTGAAGTIEIQIRSNQMHREAQFGVASHIRYKHDDEFSRKHAFEWISQFLPLSIRGLTNRGKPKKDNRITKVAGSKPSESVPNWIREIADGHQNFEGEHDFSEDMKSDFFNHRVFVFTPKGDVIDLPIDSSPVDFAYAIHSDIGNHISGAKANGKMISLDTKLKNGDIVEIMTKESAKPTTKWIDLAKTTLAKRHIRQAVVNQKER